MKLLRRFGNHSTLKGRTPRDRLVPNEVTSTRGLRCDEDYQTEREIGQPVKPGDRAQEPMPQG